MHVSKVTILLGTVSVNLRRKHIMTGTRLYLIPLNLHLTFTHFGLLLYSTAIRFLKFMPTIAYLVCLITFLTALIPRIERRRIR